MARPFLVGVTDLVRRPGTRKPVNRSVTLDGVAISTAAVAPGEDVDLDLEIESISNGIVVDGTATIPWVGACRRCLEPVRGVAVAEVREIFERHATEGETYPFSGDVIDLEPMVRDVALLALPLAPLCAEGCRGPDPESFPTRVEGEEEGDEEHGAASREGGGDGGTGKPRDPRWAALDQLGFD